MTKELNLPDVHAEMTAAFAQYEDALINNKVDVLDALFWNDPTTLRYGVNENLYSYEEIRAFRAGRPAQGLYRVLQNTRITTFGHDFAVANTEFRRPPGEKIGRQSQTWVRMPEGWRIVSAHVSLMIDPPK